VSPRRPFATETPIKRTLLAADVLARGAPEAILPPLLIGTAVLVGAGMAHIAIGQVMSTRGSDLLLYFLATPGTLLILASLFLLWFYRDPPRQPAPGLVSAADGKVLFVESVDDPDIGRATRIAVFMSPLDVHVNRVPCSAELVSSTHHEGGLVPAFRKESERNERLTTLWRTIGDPADRVPPGQSLKLVQIAGAMAKRIDPWSEPPARLQKGERFGMIRLGSRVDHYLPHPLQCTVAAGDRVRAGETTIARMP